MCGRGRGEREKERVGETKCIYGCNVMYNVKGSLLTDLIIHNFCCQHSWWFLVDSSQRNFKRSELIKHETFPFLFVVRRKLTGSANDTVKSYVI